MANQKVIEQKEKEVKDYYIYVTDSNLSTVYTLLNLVKTDDNKSFIWYTDTDLINTDYLNANKNIKISKNIGKLIPAGTGAKKYRKTDYDLKVDMLKDEPLEALEQELMD